MTGNQSSTRPDQRTGASERHPAYEGGLPGFTAVPACRRPDHSQISGALEDDLPLQQALDEYAAALSSGQPAQRERILAAHPDHAGQLAEAFDALENLYGI